MRFKNRYHSITALIIGFVFPMAAFAAERSVIVGFHLKPGQSEQELIRGIGGTIDHAYRLIPAIAVRLPEQALDQLRQHPLVAYVEDDKTVMVAEPIHVDFLLQRSFSSAAIATDIEYQDAWSVLHIGSKEVHQKGLTGTEIKVAVIDTGIDYNHEDLAANYRGGYDFIYGDDDPFDDSWNSHGTHIAGTIGAERNGIGVVGVAPEVSLYAVKSLDAAGFGTVSTIVSGIQWALDNDMDIANISIAGIDSQVLQAATDAAYAEGLLIVAAAGNTFGGPVSFPGGYDSVIAVTATDQMDLRAFGSPIDPRVELAAPGVGIWSTVQYYGYNWQSGTSQAAAHVTGVAALVMSAGVEDLNSDGLVNNKDVRLRLQMTAVDLGVQGRDDEYGFGLVNAAEAAVPPPFLSLNLVRERSWFESMERVVLEDASYQITIENDSLRGMVGLVFENHRFREDLLIRERFVNKEGDLPQKVIIDLDATGTTFKVLLIPFGKVDTSAKITIRKQ
jgi:subtilisin